MKMAVGVDSVEIHRVEKCLGNPRFVEKVYSPQEQAFLAGKGMPARTAAAYFAVKEAFGKAMGTGLRGFALGEVSVTYDKLGAPKLHLTGRAKRMAGLQKFAVSITHTRTEATAIVVAYR